MHRPLGERVRDSLRLRTLDLRDRLAGRTDRFVPPRRLGLAGHADCAETGDEFLAHAVELAGLAPDHAVLDVGCGAGRMARPLARHLGPQGSYDGLDADREAIGWCRRRYRFPYDDEACPGRWCGREDALSFQDVVVLERAA